MNLWEFEILPLAKTPRWQIVAIARQTFYKIKFSETKNP